MNINPRITFLMLVVFGLSSAAASAQSPTLNAIKEFPVAQKMFEQRMRRAVAERDRYRAMNRDAHLIVGRVQLEGNDDPETALSQMMIVEEGFFVDVIRDPKLPIGFRCHRYKPVDFLVPEDNLPGEEDIIDVGLVQLSRASASNRGEIVGTLKLEDGGDPSQVSVRLSIQNARANTPSNGTEGIGRKYTTIPGQVTAAGAISFESLSEGRYYAIFSKSGYVSASQMLEVQALQQTDIDPVTLEASRLSTLSLCPHQG